MKKMETIRDLRRDVPVTSRGKFVRRMVGGAVDHITKVNRNEFEYTVDEMLSDGQMHWGRVCVLYAYGAMLCERDEDVEEIAGILKSKTDTWISSTGGWPDEEKNKSWWRKLFF